MHQNDAKFILLGPRLRFYALLQGFFISSMSTYVVLAITFVEYVQGGTQGSKQLNYINVMSLLTSLNRTIAGAHSMYINPKYYYLLLRM